MKRDFNYYEKPNILVIKIRDDVIRTSGENDKDGTGDDIYGEGE